MGFLNAAILVTLVLTTANLQAGDWSQWRGSQRDGKATESGLNLNWEKEKPKHLWTIEGMGNGFASVSIVDGRVYTTGNLQDSQCVVCVDLETRKKIWTTPLTDRVPKHSYQGSRCTPTIDGKNCYVVTSDGQIACLRTRDGEVVWRRNFDEYRGKMMSGWGFSESPLIDGDKVLCTPGGSNAMIVALDKNSGKEIWKTSVRNQDLGDIGKDGAGYSSIVVSHGAGVKQYVQLIGRGVIGVRADDGKLLWSYDKVANKTANIPTPICYDDYVFASSGYGTGAVLLSLSRRGDGVNAKEEYFLNARTFQNHHGGMIRDGDYVYAGHQHGKGIPVCVHIPTGEVKWVGRTRNKKPEMSGSAAITYVDGKILFRYQNGTIALISASPDGFELNGAFVPAYQESKSWSHPVVVDGKLYLREQDKLMCYQL